MWNFVRIAAMIIAINALLEMVKYSFPGLSSSFAKYEIIDPTIRPR